MLQLRICLEMLETSAPVVKITDLIKEPETRYGVLRGGCVLGSV